MQVALVEIQFAILWGHAGRFALAKLLREAFAAENGGKSIGTASAASLKKFNTSNTRRDLGCIDSLTCEEIGVVSLGQNLIPCMKHERGVLMSRYHNCGCLVLLIRPSEAFCSIWPVSEVVIFVFSSQLLGQLVSAAGNGATSNSPWHQESDLAA